MLRRESAYTSLRGCRPGETALYSVISLALIAIAGYRAATTSFTHDEAVSFLSGVLPGLRHLLRYDLYVDAGNHFLNTIGMYLSYKILGPEELFLRLPSLTALLVWLASSVRLAVFLTEDRFRRLAYFLFLQSNPLLFEYFSAARGYGLSCAFTLAAVVLYLGDERLAGRRWGRDVCVILLAGAAVLSNLIALYVLTAMAFCVLGERVLDIIRPKRAGQEKKPGLSLVMLVAAAALPVIIVAPHVLRLRARQAFYFGGTEGFFRDSLGSLLASYGGSLPDMAPVVMAWLVFLMMAAVPVMFVVKVGPFASRYSLLRGGIIALVVTLQPIVAFHLIGSKYPVDRTALFLLPVTLPLFLMLSEQALRRLLGGRKHVSILLCLASCLLISQMALTMVKKDGFSFSLFDDSTRKALQDLSSHVTSRNHRPPVTLGVDWVLEPAANYYRIRLQFDWLHEVNRLGYLGDHEYYYQNRSWLDRQGNKELRDDHDFLLIRINSWNEEVQGEAYQVLRRYESSGNLLAGRRSR